MITKSIRVTLNINSTTPQRTSHVLVQNDKDVYILDLTLLDFAAPFNFSDAEYCTIAFSPPGQPPVIGEMLMTDPTKGKLTYHFGTSELSFPGTVLATVQFYGENMSRRTSPQFTFKVVADMVNDEAIESVSEYNVLTQMVDAFLANESRFDAIDSSIETINDVTIPGIKYYKWIERHIVSVGSNTITLENPYIAGQELIIFDDENGFKWTKDKHWTISGQTIEFLSSMVEDLTFAIYNLG